MLKGCLFPAEQIIQLVQVLEAYLQITFRKQPYKSNPQENT